MKTYRHKRNGIIVETAAQGYVVKGLPQLNRKAIYYRRWSRYI